jgi:hypothetical protein
MKTSPRMSTTVPKTTVDTVEPSVWPRTIRWACDSSSPSSAIRSQPATYSRMPEPPKMVSTTNRIRRISGSTPA